MPKRKEKDIKDQDVYRSLPTNRKELFFDLLKHRKMDMFYLSCLTFIFFIPLAVDLLFFNYLEIIAMSNGNEEHLFSLIFYSMIIMLPCMLIGFIGLAGAFYSAKKLVWQELVIPASDFFKGIKENWKHALIHGMLFGIVTFGLVVGGIYLYLYSPAGQVTNGIGIGVLIVLFIIFGILTSLMLAQDVYYENTYRHTFKNAFSFLVLTNWKTMLLFILTTGVLVALCAINLVTIIIGLVLFALCNYLVIVLYTLIAHSVFDKYINKEHYPNMINKGLYKKQEETVKEA